jgi:hypothetical protein
LNKLPIKHGRFWIEGLANAEPWARCYDRSGVGRCCSSTWWGFFGTPGLDRSANSFAPLGEPRPVHASHPDFAENPVTPNTELLPIAMSLVASFELA